MAMMEAPQSKLFNTETKSINPYWIDPDQPLLVPVNPLHYQAHKLQLMLTRMELQSSTNAAQFNSANYNAMLTKFTEICQAINDGKTANDLSEPRVMGENGDPGSAPAMGEGNAPSVGPGVSADNPTAG